mgnify:CR=1 FL=1
MSVVKYLATGDNEFAGLMTEDDETGLDVSVLLEGRQPGGLSSDSVTEMNDVL